MTTIDLFTSQILIQLSPFDLPDYYLEMVEYLLDFAHKDCFKHVISIVSILSLSSIQYLIHIPQIHIGS